MPLFSETATLWWAVCSICGHSGPKRLDTAYAMTDLGTHMNAVHPGWETLMQKMRNGIDPKQHTIEESIDAITE